MKDEFNFGEPAKHPARLGPHTTKRAGGSVDPRVVWIVAGLVVAGVLAFVFLRSADEAGKQIADSQTDAVSQIDRAYDAAAQGTMGRAVVVALSLHAERGSFTTDLATLSAYDPELRFTSGPSKDPMTISYAVDAAGFGAAVRSESGSCWWAKIAANSVTTYGSGKPCTGSAAMSASAASW
ncbi:MAG: hypothetical protein H0W97_11625 [Actinobacteria bacterium]|nr:hypothetical protein [Actinomycetota bacterium]